MQTQRFHQLFVACALTLAVGCAGSGGSDVDDDSHLAADDGVCPVSDPHCPELCVKAGFGKCHDVSSDPCAEFENGVCPPPPEPGCTMPHGFWKDNLEAWPIDGLTIGEYTYSNEALNEFLGNESLGNAGLILVRQYVAAVLNVAAGAGSLTIDEAAADALAWLENSVDTLPGDVGTFTEEGAEALEIKAVLQAFNQGEIGPGSCMEEVVEEEVVEEEVL